jgi:hypothetical protein
VLSTSATSGQRSWIARRDFTPSQQLATMSNAESRTLTKLGRTIARDGGL